MVLTSYMSKDQGTFDCVCNDPFKLGILKMLHIQTLQFEISERLNQFVFKSSGLCLSFK